MKARMIQAAFIAALLTTPIFADDSQNLTMQNVTLVPGDVIDFVGGGGSEIIAGDTYGHTAMYLGFDPEKNEKVFLDFTTSKGTNRGKYFGRISNASQFLADNKGHGEFDVFRVNDHSVDQGKLIDTAKSLAVNKPWGPTDCANAVSQTLGAAAGLDLHAIRPDMYAEDSHFTQANHARVDIQTALGEVKGEPDGGAINGTWSGNVSQTNTNSFPITLHIQNVTSGDAQIAGQCTGSLSGVSQGGGTYVYNLSINSGPCIPGTVTLVLGSPQMVHYSWNGVDPTDGPVSSSAVLYKR